MNEIKVANSIFESIKHIDEFGHECWYARELQSVLEYRKWENFHTVIKQAMVACENSNNNVNYWFPEVRKSIISGKGRKSQIIDYKLSRYACYKGLYNGETANDITKRKGLKYREDILDNMGSEELADNLFRIVQAEAKLDCERVNTETKACNIHYDIGRGVRSTIKKFGGTMPENLPTPEKSLKELEKQNIISN